MVRRARGGLCGPAAAVVRVLADASFPVQMGVPLSGVGPVSQTQLLQGGSRGARRAPPLAVGPPVEP